MGGTAGRLAGVVVALAVAASGCRTPPPNTPSILWVVWDTVRADHLSLYGYGKPTTPHLDTWAAQARVFDDCLAPSSTTVPSHASMFTGLLPRQHGAHNADKWLDDDHVTIAEILRARGYRTYLFSANPSVSRDTNLTQGFDFSEHPWDAAHEAEALRVLRGKLEPGDRSNELAADLDSGELRWNLEASGEIVVNALSRWLAREPRRPFFAFVNYMEAHQPLVPPRRFRERMMTPAEVDASYRVDRTWDAIWRYNFGLKDLPPEDLALTAATYDAALVELDELLHDLLETLAAGGWLEDTIVVLTSDHGEHLGEHHLLDHQYSLYRPLLRVPLVVRYPRRMRPGREARPVMTVDLFSTLLELVGVYAPTGGSTTSLLRPADRRVRLAAYPAPLVAPFRTVRRLHPDFDPTPWRRALRALIDPPFEYIWASDGRHQLYDFDADPAESHDLIAEQPGVAARLAAQLDATVAALSPRKATGRIAPRISPEQRRRLAALGYIDADPGADPSAAHSRQTPDKGKTP